MKFNFGYQLFWFLWSVTWAEVVVLQLKSGWEMWICFLLFLIFASIQGNRLANLFLAELKNKD